VLITRTGWSNISISSFFIYKVLKELPIITRLCDGDGLRALTRTKIGVNTAPALAVPVIVFSIKENEDAAALKDAELLAKTLLFAFEDAPTKDDAKPVAVLTLCTLEAAITEEFELPDTVIILTA
tara:strand:- start:271 stop:645 length:375 start_codon:yes stop_codon:yes gene_type:complete